MNRDELKGKAEALKGRIKQAAGTITRDPDLHDEGVIDEVAGKTQSAVGCTGFAASVGADTALAVDTVTKES